jgi:hypothetical protein
MNKRIDYLFKALTLRLLLALFQKHCRRDDRFEAEVEACADECAAISDGRAQV